MWRRKEILKRDWRCDVMSLLTPHFLPWLWAFLHFLDGVELDSTAVENASELLLDLEVFWASCTHYHREAHDFVPTGKFPTTSTYCTKGFFPASQLEFFSGVVDLCLFALEVWPVVENHWAGVFSLLHIEFEQISSFRQMAAQKQDDQKWQCRRQVSHPRHHLVRRFSMHSTAFSLRHSWQVLRRSHDSTLLIAPPPRVQGVQLSNNNKLRMYK